MRVRRVEEDTVAGFKDPAPDHIRSGLVLLEGGPHLNKSLAVLRGTAYQPWVTTARGFSIGFRMGAGRRTANPAWVPVPIPTPVRITGVALRNSGPITATGDALKMMASDGMVSSAWMVWGFERAVMAKIVDTLIDLPRSALCAPPAALAQDIKSLPISSASSSLI